MTRTIITMAATGAIAALSLAGAVYAQSGETKKDSSVAMMHDCPMMKAAAEGPTSALKHRGALRLTEAQVKRLEAVEQRARDETRAALTKEQRDKLEEAAAGAMVDMHRMMPMMGGIQGTMGDRKSGMKDMSECPMMKGMMRNGMDMRMHGDSGSAQPPEALSTTTTTYPKEKL